MKGLFIIFFIEFIVIGFVVTLFMGSDSMPKPISDLHNAVMCGGNGTVAQETTQSSYHRSSEVDMNFYCIDENGDATDVTWKFILIFLGTIGFTMVGIFTMVLTGKFATNDAEKSARLKELTGKMGVDNVSLNDLRQSSRNNRSETLSEQLKQLDQSYEERLINREEYDDARRRILDNMGR